MKSHALKAEQIRQQVSLWIFQGDKACLRRQFILGIRYYQQALDLARRECLRDLQGRLCRDLSYVYLHHGAYHKAIRLLDEGLSLGVDYPELHLGLLINKVSTCLAQKNYQQSFETAEEAIRYFLERYPSPEKASFALLTTYNALRQLRRDLKKVMDLLHSGIRQDRIQVDFHLAPPPWANNR